MSLRLLAVLKLLTAPFGVLLLRKNNRNIIMNTSNALPALTIANICIGQDSQGRYCLNDLHKAAGGKDTDRPKNWLAIEQTQALIEIIDGGKLPSEQNQAVSIIKGGNTQQGTFVVKELVYAYAMWISPAFHINVIRAYDAMVMHSNALPSLLNPANKTMTVTEFKQWQASVKTALNLVIKQSVESITIITSADDYLGLVMGKNTPDTNRLINGINTNEPRPITKETPPEPPKQRIWRKNEIQQMKAYYDDGLTYNEIGIKLGRSERSVAHAIMRHLNKGGAA
jgi:hypothetical protein